MYFKLLKYNNKIPLILKSSKFTSKLNFFSPFTFGLFKIKDFFNLRLGI
jgi:hypothetical protein